MWLGIGGVVFLAGDSHGLGFADTWSQAARKRAAASPNEIPFNLAFSFFHARSIRSHSVPQMRALNVGARFDPLKEAEWKMLGRL